MGFFTNESKKRRDIVMNYETTLKFPNVALDSSTWKYYSSEGDYANDFILYDWTDSTSKFKDQWAETYLKTKSLCVFATNSEISLNRLKYWTGAAYIVTDHQCLNGIKIGYPFIYFSSREANKLDSISSCFKQMLLFLNTCAQKTREGYTVVFEIQFHGTDADKGSFTKRISNYKMDQKSYAFGTFYNSLRYSNADSGGLGVAPAIIFESELKTHKFDSTDYRFVTWTRAVIWSIANHATANLMWLEDELKNHKMKVILYDHVLEKDFEKFLIPERLSAMPDNSKCTEIEMDMTGSSEWDITDFVYAADRTEDFAAIFSDEDTEVYKKGLEEHAEDMDESEAEGIISTAVHKIKNAISTQIDNEQEEISGIQEAPGEKKAKKLKITKSK